MIGFAGWSGAERSLAFWRLAIKPGCPVAVFVTFVRVVRPLIAALCGAAFEPARGRLVTSGIKNKKKNGRREYVRVSLRSAAIAEKYSVEGAAVLTSLTRMHGFVESADAS